MMKNLCILTYLFVWLTATVALLFAIATFNVMVDPYGLFRLVDKPGFNRIKPTAAAQGAMTKAYQVLRVQPRGLILGNSRAEVGIDPNHPAWPEYARPVYNLALPGTGTTTSLRYLQHALVATDGNPTARPKMVVWGIDIMDFLTDPTVMRSTPSIGKDDRRLLAMDNTTRWQQQIRDYSESIMTLTALLNSVQTLAAQRDPYAIDLTSQGFNPMRDYLKISADEGYWNVFRQKDQANIKAYLRRPNSILNASGRTSHQLDDLREVLRLCRQNGIDLRIFIYPYHAHLLEIFRITGHWPVFEVWKRTLVQILADEAKTTGKQSFELWDFSAFNEFTTEAIPSKGDRKSTMRWYWEGGHFKRELGILILNRMLDRAVQPSEFGVLLTPDNVNMQIMSVRVLEDKYRRTHTQEINELVNFSNQRKSK
jgi:hypothetical protein